MLKFQSSRLLGALLLLACWFSACSVNTNKNFVADNLIDTGMDYRATTIEDVRLYATEQLLKECQGDCKQLERQLEMLRTSVSRYEDYLRGVKPPPPPCPCPQAQCAWAKGALLSYVIDLTKNAVRGIRVEDVQGQVLAISVLGSERMDDDGRFAVIDLKPLVKELPTGLVNVVVERLGENNRIITETLRVNALDN